MIRRAAGAALFFTLILAALPASAAESNPYVERAIFSSYAVAAYRARIGDWAGAAAELERAYRLRQTSPEILTRLAEAYLRVGRNPEAEKFAARALQEDSTAADACLILAEIAGNRGESLLADSYLVRRLALKPDDLESRLRLGLLRENRNDLAGVVEAFRGYPALKPGAAAAQFHLGVALVRLKRYEEARRAFHDALRENPNYAEAAENIAIISEELGDDSAALTAWGRVLAINPGRLEASRRRLTLFVESERYDEAVTELESMLAQSPDKNNALRKLLARLAIQKGDFALAARTMLVLAQRTGTETGYLETALLAARSGTETAALVSALEGAWAIGARPHVGVLLAQAYAAAGEETRAQERLAGLSLDEIRDTVALWSLGLTWHRFGDETRAIEIFLRVIALEPRNASALNYVGYTWAEKGWNLDRAEELVRKALEIDPENPQYIDSLGWIFYQRGQYDMARLSLEKAHQFMPGEPTIMEHLADAYARLGMRREALVLYRAAAATGRAETPEILAEKLGELEKCLGEPPSAESRP